MRFPAGRLFSGMDWWLFSGALAMSGFGLLLLYGLAGPLFLKQAMWLVAGLAVFFAAGAWSRHWWRNASFFFYAVVVLFLVWLLLAGETTRGTRGWFYLGPFALQPAEFAKISVMLFLAATLEKLNFDIANWRHLLRVLTILALPVGLIFLQPDFGSAFVLTVVGLTMIFYTGLERRHFLLLVLSLLVVAATGWLALHDYQRTRILGFINPGFDPLGAGYNVRQAIVAIGSGGITGRGLGLGPQSQLNFLPEQETDFIFASLAEELGFIGAFSLLMLWLFFLWRLWHTLKAGEHLFTNFLLLGIFMMFLTEAVVNLGMNMGLFPVTGLTLPFTSYGGSSLVSSWLALGLAQSSRRV